MINRRERDKGREGEERGGKEKGKEEERERERRDCCCSPGNSWPAYQSCGWLLQ
jgi:hypothetical protein